MTTFLLSLLLAFAFITYARRTIKRVLIKPVAKSGLVGPELLAEKTRWDVWVDWLRPAVYGVMVGAMVWPCGMVMGWW